jgi:hypothetical protein
MTIYHSSGGSFGWWRRRFHRNPERVSTMNLFELSAPCSAWDLACRMDAHEGQAAWVQAVGSIAAILASSAFAIWVPLRMRDLEGRDLARRSLNNLIFVAGALESIWRSMKTTVEKSQYSSGARALLESQMAGVRALLSEVHRHTLGPDALLALGMFEMQFPAIESALSAIERALALGEAPQLAFDEGAARVRSKLMVLSDLDAVRKDGVWRVNCSVPHRGLVGGLRAALGMKTRPGS